MAGSQINYKSTITSDFFLASREDIARKMMHEIHPTACIESDVGPDIRWGGNEMGFGGPECWAAYDPKSFQPDRKGRIHPDDVKKLKTFGDELGKMLSNDFVKEAEIKRTDDGLELTFRNEVEFNVVRLMEDCRYGQRIDDFAVEYFDGEWNPPRRTLSSSKGHMTTRRRSRRAASRASVRISNGKYGLEIAIINILRPFPLEV